MEDQKLTKSHVTTTTPACFSSAEAVCGPHLSLGHAAEQAAEAAAKLKAGEPFLWFQPPLRPLLAGHEDAGSPVCSGNGTEDALSAIGIVLSHFVFYYFLIGVPSQKRRMPGRFLATPRALLA